MRASRNPGRPLFGNRAAECQRSTLAFCRYSNIHLYDSGMFGRRTIIFSKMNNEWKIMRLHASGIEFLLNAKPWQYNNGIRLSRSSHYNLIQTHICQIQIISF
jgi:hypothetical protein